MSLKANYEFLFVGKDDSSFLENYYYDLFKDHGKDSGQIFVNIEVENNPLYAEEIGGLIFETMKDEFFKHLDRDPYKRFELSLKAVNQAVQDFKKEKNAFLGTLNIVVAVILGEELFISQCGDSEVYLVRKRLVSVISEGLSEDAVGSEDLFASIASGKIEVGDFVLISSTRLLRYIGKNDLIHCLGSKSVEKSLDKVKDVISTEILGRIGLIGIVFDEMSAVDEDIVENFEDHETEVVMEANGPTSDGEKQSISGTFYSIVDTVKRKVQKFEFLNSAKKLFAPLFSKGFSKDKFLAILVVLIFVLSIVILVVNNNSQDKEMTEKYSRMLDQVEAKVAEANAKGTYDKLAARTLLEEAYADAKVVMDSGYFRQKVPLILDDISIARDLLDNVQRIEAPEVFLNLNEKAGLDSAVGIVQVKDQVFVYDQNTVYEILVDEVKEPIVLDEDETIVAATAFDNRRSVVFLTASSKLIELRDGNVTFMDTEDEAFKGGVALANWANNIYILDDAGKQIWKYVYRSTRERFDSVDEYVPNGLDLENTKDLAIDGSIYVLNSQGVVNKFYAGAKQDFYLNDLPDQAFISPNRLFVSESSDKVFILDSLESRLVLMKKDNRSGNLVYDSQYVFPTVGVINDLYVDNDLAQVFLLTSDKIYLMNI